MRAVVLPPVNVPVARECKEEQARPRARATEYLVMVAGIVLLCCLVLLLGFNSLPVPPPSATPSPSPFAPGWVVLSASDPVSSAVTVSSSWASTVSSSWSSTVSSSWSSTWSSSWSSTWSSSWSSSASPSLSPSLAPSLSPSLAPSLSPLPAPAREYEARHSAHCAPFTDQWCQDSCTHVPPHCPGCCVRRS